MVVLPTPSLKGSVHPISVSRVDQKTKWVRVVVTYRKAFGMLFCGDCICANGSADKPNAPASTELSAIAINEDFPL